MAHVVASVSKQAASTHLATLPVPGHRHVVPQVVHPAGEQVIRRRDLKRWFAQFARAPAVTSCGCVQPAAGTGVSLCAGMRRSSPADCVVDPVVVALAVALPAGRAGVSIERQRTSYPAPMMLTVQPPQLVLPLPLPLPLPASAQHLSPPCTLAGPVLTLWTPPPPTCWR